jgi:glycosyltransferase 2 family protein
LRSALLVASIGLALHLVLPHIPGLERSLRLVVDTSHLLVEVAFVVELAGELSYAELLGQAVRIVSGSGLSLKSRRRRGIGRWFMLRLTVTGYGVAHILPGGGAATVTYGVLRSKGFDPAKVPSMYRSAQTHMTARA